MQPGEPERDAMAGSKGPELLNENPPRTAQGIDEQTERPLAEERYKPLANPP